MPALLDLRTLDVDQKEIFRHAKAAVDSARLAGLRRVTVDFPESRKELSCGTLVRRFEVNSNFALNLAKALAPEDKAVEPVGELVEIRDCVNPQGGGEYLSEEGMTGFRVELGNGEDGYVLFCAGVDFSRVKECEPLVSSSGLTVLVNAGIEKLSFLDKLGARKFLDSFEPIYVVKRVGGSGFVVRQYPEDWQVYGIAKAGACMEKIGDATEKRPPQSLAESLVRAAQVQ